MNGPKKEKYLTKNEVLSKMMSFCAYQERSHWEVRNKLFGYLLSSDEKEEIIAHLIEQNFISESRFANAYAGGKFRIKKWGRKKIEKELHSRDISEKNIQQALSQIEEQDYKQSLQELLEKKNRTIKEKDLLKRKYKLIQYALSKGYESDLVISLTEKLNLNER